MRAAAASDLFRRISSVNASISAVPALINVRGTARRFVTLNPTSPLQGIGVVEDRRMRREMRFPDAVESELTRKQTEFTG